MVVQTTEDDSTSSVHTRKDSNEASLVENSTDPSNALVRADSFDVEDSDKPKEEVRQFDALKRTAFEAATEEQEMSGKTRGRLLAAVCFLEIIANFDAGVLPATIGASRSRLPRACCIKMLGEPAIPAGGWAGVAFEKNLPFRWSCLG